MQKNLILIIIGFILLAGGFWGGYANGSSKSRNTFNPANFAGGNRAANFNVTGGQMIRRGGQNGGGFAQGEIIAKDEQSITVKMSDGSTKIIFYSSGTDIAKTAVATVDDLTVGENALVSGQASSDGSIAASNIQLRPAQTIKPVAPAANQSQ